MHTFKDKTEKEWAVDVDLGTIRVIEDFDFSEALRTEDRRHISFLPPEEDLFTSLLTNTRVLFCCLWLCCRDQAIDRGIDNIEQFAEVFSGPSLNEARLAFLEELPPFFPDMMTSLRALIETYSSVMQEADKQITAKLKKTLSPERIKAEVTEAVESLDLSLKPKRG